MSKSEGMLLQLTVEHFQLFKHIFNCFIYIHNTIYILQTMEAETAYGI